MPYRKSLLLGKPIFSVRQKGVPPLLLPASVQQLPRCLVRICNLFHKDNQLRIGKFQKVQLQQENQSSKSNLLRKCGLLAHTSAAFLKNCCTEKLFSCLRLGSYSKHATKFVSHQPYFPQVLRKWLKYTFTHSHHDDSI